MVGNKNEIIETLNSMFHLISNISESLNDFTYKDEINGRLHDELQKYKGGLRKEFTSPLNDELLLTIAIHTGQQN